MFAITSKQMKKLDEEIVKKYNIPSILLMENAASNVVKVLKSKIKIKNNNILILVGKGNNGGYALAVGRILFGLKAKIVFFIVDKDLKKMSKDCKIQFDIIKKMKIPYFFDLKKLNKFFCHSNFIVIDGILGTGFKNELNEKLKKILKEINNLKCYKISIDIPTGINSDNGKGDIYFKSNLIITFEYLKIAHILKDDIGDIFLKKNIL